MGAAVSFIIIKLVVYTMLGVELRESIRMLIDILFYFILFPPHLAFFLSDYCTDYGRHQAACHC